jgi:trk system potassium uptake protein TrkH
MNIRYSSRLIGLLLLVMAATMATSLIWAFIDSDQQAIRSFVYSSIITTIAGILMILLGLKSKGDLYIKEALVITAFSWFLAGVFGALPYMFEGTFNTFTSAFFEAVSGFSTTGSTAIVVVENESRALLYWRSLTQWLGGMGIIVLFIAILPRLGVGAKHLFKSEVPGPITSSFRPKLKETSGILWKFYLGFTLAEIIVLKLLGMSVYDSICHSLTTMSTGGFSTITASISGFNNPAIEYALCFFMFAAGVNFYLYFLIAKGHTTSVFKDPEFKIYAAITGTAAIILTIAIFSIHGDFFVAFRKALFQTIAISTTTGFGTDNFEVYPSYAKIILIVLMFIGGSAGSTAGGMKVSRIMVLVKLVRAELFKAVHPKAVVAIKIGDNPIQNDIAKSIAGFFILFIIVFVVGSIFMAALGLDIITAFSSVVACLANIGPGLGRVGSIENFAFIPEIGKLFLSFCMILGRLELFTVMALAMPAFWKK